ncbi:low temperature requirement protein A [Streptomyces griseosporeus]|uniref:low temperature requirement protein A n=1 Tax=Streptomyces griseosporeus TaxID=1910 RepID=UPI00167D1E26|nr:low temperature requirement protein A [Streptomyces griseosporeus]GHF50953.1 hypothetical protein GCM10018783_19440 [Streptomyces griseosporeus]
MDGLDHEEEDQHARVLALAYVLIRVLANQSWQRRRQLLVDWPAAQMSLGVTPWIVSLWAHAPVRYWLWALGVALDLYVTFAVSAREFVKRHKDENQHEALERSTSRMEGGSSRSQPPVTGVVVARSQAEHLSERLGLFVLIVLGEGIAQVVYAASDVAWHRDVWTLGVASFFLLAAVWTLSLRHGYSGVPHWPRESCRPEPPCRCTASCPAVSRRSPPRWGRLSNTPTRCPTARAG